MALQKVVFYDGVDLVILYVTISFIMYFSIILLFSPRVSDAHTRKQFFFLGVVFHAKGLLKDRKSYKIFSPTSGTLHPPYPTLA